MRIIWKCIFLIKISLTQSRNRRSPPPRSTETRSKKTKRRKRRKRKKTGSPRPWRRGGGSTGPRLGRFSVPPAAPHQKPDGVRSVLFQSSSRTRRLRATPWREHACLHPLRAAVTQPPPVRNANDRARYRR